MYKVFINEISISFLSEEENTTNYGPYQRLPTFKDSPIKVEEFISFIEKLDFIDLINVRKLFLFKSRINSLRIFKLLVISEFIEDYKLIANN